jgi:hypothetical protein
MSGVRDDLIGDPLAAVRSMMYLCYFPMMSLSLLLLMMMMLSAAVVVMSSVFASVSRLHLHPPMSWMD